MYYKINCWELTSKIIELLRQYNFHAQNKVYSM